MILTFEWRVPWPNEWDGERKLRAAEKLVDYMERGTMFETQRRMKVVQARACTVASTTGESDPWIEFTLEG